MPLHDWLKGEGDVYHEFHSTWVVYLRNALNRGLLPEGFRAHSERHGSVYIPDVITLRSDFAAAPAATVAVPVAERRQHAARRTDVWTQRRVVVRAAGKQVVAIVELVSRSIKSSKARATAISMKVADLLLSGVHVAVADPFPPSKSNPNGLHPLVWKVLGRKAPPPPPEGRPYTFVGYRADDAATAYLNYIAIGQSLPVVPLFLTEDRFVTLPLEETYTAAFADLAPDDREKLDGPGDNASG